MTQWLNVALLLLGVSVLSLLVFLMVRYTNQRMFYQLLGHLSGMQALDLQSVFAACDGRYMHHEIREAFEELEGMGLVKIHWAEQRRNNRFEITDAGKVALTRCRSKERITRELVA